MKILKEGKKLEDIQTLFFICDYCGCEYRFSKLIEGIDTTVEKDYFKPDISMLCYFDAVNDVFEDDDMTAVYIPLNADLDIIIR